MPTPTFKHTDAPVVLPSRIGVLGDVHDDLGFLFSAFDWFSKNGVEHIIQLGDYWAYDGTSRPTKVNRRAAQYGVHLYFIDGNHEGYNYLLPEMVHSTAPWTMGEHVTYLSRGLRGTVGSKSFLAMGGAVSTDKHYRTEGKHWWADETLNDTDVVHGTTGDPVDYFFSHDIARDCLNAHTVRAVHDAETEASLHEFRRRMNEVYRYHSPSMVFHGHYHVHYIETVHPYSAGPTTMVGLADNTHRKKDMSGLIFDADTDTILDLWL